ncbi:MAG: S8 family serine peptidase, partial [bacterium]|nr:S8 family serine peptidase [bacterium]
MRLKISVLSLFTFTLLLMPMATVEAQGLVPPGLEQAPPCLDPAMMPSQARVPCAGIVAFREGTTSTQREEKIQQAGGKLKVNFRLFNAAAVTIPDEASLSALQSDPDVVAVIPDRVVQARPKPDKPGKPGNGGGGSSGQSVSSGLSRIGAAPGVLPVTGQGMGVAIVDTGLDSSHADLNVSPSCFSAYSSCEDGDGHGTHVGGIVAAKDNDIDTVGVAPDATLY